ncbi:MAG: DUF2235 domain-containing protein [Planctomycetes bacterium]|nr:DUF2235 domain-containing protein [Planctomycetota bacterium]
MSTASALPQPAEPVADPDEGVEVVVVPVVPAPREPEMARVVARHNARREVVGSVAPGPYEPVGDEIDVDDDSRVVTWTPEHPTSWFRQKDGTPVAIGHVDDHGWVNLDQRLGGGRMLMSALETLADGQSFGPEERLLAAEQARLGEAGFDQKLATILEPAKSPYAIVPGSQNIALFLDGTSNWRDHQTNISTLYDQFQGTKFYYGGVGNAAEYARVDQAKLGGGAGLEFDAIIERAIEDLRENWQPGMRIHVFGFSRGGAEAIELARRLEKHGIKIEGHPENQKPEIAMLGLFDPVYSVGQPGQDSTFTKSTPEGRAGNFVSVDLPTNVRHVRALYAQHEERSWFPATQLIVDSAAKTTVDLGVIPGVHSDGGGHKENNQHIAMLARHWIAAGYKSDPFADAFDLSSAEFATATSDVSPKLWAFGGCGIQGDHTINYAFVADAALFGGIGALRSNQSINAQYPRDLSWVKHAVITHPGLQQVFAQPKADVERHWASEDR